MRAAAAPFSLGDLCLVHGWGTTPLLLGCTWPQVSFVGATEEQAREAAQKAGYGDKLAVVKTSFRANSKVCSTQGGRVDLHQAEEIIVRDGGQRDSC